jgi:8-amino-7-oxononanoate synthase
MISQIYNHYENQNTKKINSNIFRKLKFHDIHVSDFSHNDYLNITCDKEVISFAAQAVLDYSIGARSSRLLRDNKLYCHLEEMIAQTYNKQACLVFVSGYQLNSSVILSLLNSLECEPLLFCDKLNHASINQAIFAANKRQIRYNNCDLDHLENLLRKYKDCNQPKFIFTESVFSMDGSSVDLKRLIDLKKEYNCFLYLDEAHALGVYGDNGYGLSSVNKYYNDIDIIMGSFSKALGCQGAFICCNNIVKDYILNYCPGFIYTTALPPSSIATITFIWKKIANMSKERDNLFKNITYYKSFHRVANHSPIIPFICEEIATAELLYEKLLENNILTSLIKPPTCRNPRLRISINSGHRNEEIKKLATLLQESCI